MEQKLHELFKLGEQGLTAALPMVLPAPWDQNEAADEHGVPETPYVIGTDLAAAASEQLVALVDELCQAGPAGLGVDGLQGGGPNTGGQGRWVRRWA